MELRRGAGTDMKSAPTSQGSDEVRPYRDFAWRFWMIRDLLYRVRALVRRGVVESELDEELKFHYERQVAKLVAAGMGVEEARRQARLLVGGVEQVKEECREARGVEL